MIEPLTTVHFTKPKNKTTYKSAAKRRKSSKKGESKVVDLYEKENPLKPIEAEASLQDIKNTENAETFKILPDVATPDLDKGNPEATLTSDIPESGRKQGLKDLNDAIDSTENMDIDHSNTGNETKVADSVEKDRVETDAREDVGPDVGTSLGQPDNSNGDTTTGFGGKDPSFETAPKKEVNSGNSDESSYSEKGKESEENSKKIQEEECSVGKEKDKDVVDDLDQDDVPLVNTLSEILAKRLRSNKGKAILSASKVPKKKTTSVTETPKSRTKSTIIGLKNVKIAAGSSSKRKVIFLSESEYNVEEDVPNIITSIVKRYAGKKSVQIVENVPVDKVSFHLPEFAQRWKFIYHKRLALERVLSEETVKIKVVMELIVTPYFY